MSPLSTSVGAQDLEMDGQRLKDGDVDYVDFVYCHTHS